MTRIKDVFLADNGCRCVSQMWKAKEEIRRVLRLLLEDARDNAEAHAETAQDKLPLSARSPAWPSLKRGAQSARIVAAREKVSSAFGDE